MHNPTSGSELGILTDKELDIIVLFKFQDVGYVKDADKEKLDADDLSEVDPGRNRSVERRPARSVAGRRSRSSAGTRRRSTTTETNNLEWCIKGESEGQTLNQLHTRILGREGVMSANLMVDPEKLDATLPVS